MKMPLFALAALAFFAPAASAATKFVCSGCCPFCK